MIIKRTNKKIISSIILLIIIFLFIYYLSKNISDFKQLFSLAFSFSNILFLILVIFFIILNLFFTGYILDVLASSFGIKLKLKESLGLAIITRFYNTIIPFRGGMAARAIYLKKKHDFAYINFLATLSAIYILILLMGSFTGLLSMFYIWQTQGFFNWIIFFLFSSVFIFMLLIIIFFPKFKEKKNKWINKIIKIINGWYLIKNDKKLILYISIISLIQLVLGSITILFFYYIFNIQINFFQALFIFSISTLAILISITPGNLGVGDTINVFSATIIGIELSGAVAVVILSRVIRLLIIAILGPIFSYKLLKNKPKLKEEINLRNLKEN